jgi:hypothetical protein
VIEILGSRCASPRRPALLVIAISAMLASPAVWIGSTDPARAARKPPTPWASAFAIESTPIPISSTVLLADRRAGRPPRMLYPTLSYDPGGAPYIWHRWLKPRSWTDGDDVSVTHARWTSWKARSATARVRVVLGGVRGRGRVTLSSPGYCPVAHAYGFLEERDYGGVWGNGGTVDLSQLCHG